MFVAVWEFQVHEAARAAFEVLYGPNAAWVALFRADLAYQSTELLADRTHAGRYLTASERLVGEYERPAPG